MFINKSSKTGSSEWFLQNARQSRYRLLVLGRRARMKLGAGQGQDTQAGPQTPTWCRLERITLIAAWRVDWAGGWDVGESRGTMAEWHWSDGCALGVWHQGLLDVGRGEFLTSGTGVQMRYFLWGKAGEVCRGWSELSAALHAQDFWEKCDKLEKGLEMPTAGALRRTMIYPHFRKKTDKYKGTSVPDTGLGSPRYHVYDLTCVRQSNHYQVDRYCRGPGASAAPLPRTRGLGPTSAYLAADWLYDFEKSLLNSLSLSCVFKV